MERIGDNMRFAQQELEQMRAIDIIKVDRSELVDISEIQIDTNKTVTNRVKDYIEKVKNPFLVRIGDYVVKINYSDIEETVDSRMQLYISKIAQIKY